MTNEQTTRVLTALTEPIRRQALAHLWYGGEMCVCELMKQLGATQSRMSRHMAILKSAGLVVDRRDAQWVRYRRHPQVSGAIGRIVESVLNADKCFAQLDQGARSAGEFREKLSA